MQILNENPIQAHFVITMINFVDRQGSYSNLEFKINTYDITNLT